MSLGQNPPFKMHSSVTVSTSTSSANAAIPAPGPVAMVSNISTGVLYVVFGGSNSVTATATNGYLVQPNSTRAIACGVNSTFVAGLLSTSTGTMYVEIGDGSAH